MAYTIFPNKNVGDPVTKDDFDIIRDNFEDHEARLIDVEQNIAKIQVFNELIINSVYIINAGLEDVLIYRAEADFTLTEAKLIVLEGGLSGICEIDVLKSSSLAGPFTSIFSTKPSLDAGAGSNVESTNAVFSTTAVSSGDYLKLNFTSFQVRQKRVMIHVFGEAV